MDMIYSSLTDAIKDTIVIIPFLFVIFLIIEVVEHFYSNKILKGAKFLKNSGPAFGALLAAIPQCGLSVIASTLYCRRIITKGTLIAVYLATSDEAIPVLISNPKGLGVVVPLILIKIAVGLFAGYLIDILMPPSLPVVSETGVNIEYEKGCHSHNISVKSNQKSLYYVIKELLYHPVVHTISVTFFVFLITFLINLFFSYFALHPLLFIDLDILQNKIFQPCLAALFGIIPNCAVSVGITVMYLKGAITFASCVSGLCAGAGLGILVLMKNNEDKKDTIKIILLLLVISILAGLFVSAF